MYKQQNFFYKISFLNYFFIKYNLMNTLSKDILIEIISYVVQPKYKMVDWIKPFFNKVKDNNDNIWFYLGCNKFSHDFILENYPEKFNWNLGVSDNPNAVDFIIENIDKVDKSMLHYNPDYKIYKYYSNNDKITFYNPFIIDKIENQIFEKSGLFNDYPIRKLSKSSIFDFFANPNASIIFEKYEDKINWNIFNKYKMCQRFFKYPLTYQFFIRNHDKIKSKYIYQNPLIIEYANNNIDKIKWDTFTKNINIEKFIFEKVDGIYIANSYLKKLKNSSIAKNCNLVKFFITNSFYYNDTKYIGIEYIKKIANKKKYYELFINNKEAIPLMIYKYIKQIIIKKKYNCLLFSNPGIFEVDVVKSLERYNKFISTYII